jgi:hypothetical protein
VLHPDVKPCLAVLVAICLSNLRRGSGLEIWLGHFVDKKIGDL